MCHAHVATADFLMDIRTHQICLLETDSDHVSLQQKTDSTHVSSFQFLLYSQLADSELHFELLTNGIEHPAHILQMLVTLPLGVFESLNLLH